ncbi:hypothetical protein C8F04DRAFT_1114820, partial [Mycena alexandri]
YKLLIRNCSKKNFRLSLFPVLKGSASKSVSYISKSPPTRRSMTFLLSWTLKLRNLGLMPAPSFNLTLKACTRRRSAWSMSNSGLGNLEPSPLAVPSLPPFSRAAPPIPASSNGMIGASPVPPPSREPKPPAPPWPPEEISSQSRFRNSDGTLPPMLGGSPLTPLTPPGPPGPPMPPLRMNKLNLRNQRND